MTEIPEYDGFGIDPEEAKAWQLEERDRRKAEIVSILECGWEKSDGS